MCKIFHLVQINFCTALFVRKFIHANILFTPCVNWSSRGPEVERSREEREHEEWRSLGLKYFSNDILHSLVFNLAHTCDAHVIFRP